MNKLQGKDLINVGIFTAIYFVVMMAIAMLGFIPIFLPLLIVLVPLIGGIVMMLYYSKVQKFGMVSLTGLICGILMLLTGMGYWSIITGAVFGVLADLVLKSGDYKSAKKGIISHGVFSMWIIGNYIPIVATRDSYYQQLISGYGQEYADSIMSYISAYTLPLLLIAGFVCGVIGGLGQNWMNPALAARCFMLTPWKSDRILVDPFCGSGTFPIEAAMIAANMAPGMNREFLSEDWKHLIPRKCWYDANEEAQDRINLNIETDIQGFDIDPEALKAARANAKMAGVDKLIHFQQRPEKQNRRVLPLWKVLSLRSLR
jgi:energy-coupling factor transport system substrate-specific component